MDENSSQHEIRDEQRQQIADLKRCLGFFASVIKSGEPWTETCQQEYDKAMGR